MSSLAVTNPGGGCEGQAVSGSGSTLKPYLRRKKSSLGETKVAVLGMNGVGKSGELLEQERYRSLCAVLVWFHGPRQVHCLVFVLL